MELQCHEKDCPPLETVIAVMEEGLETRQCKFHKPITEVTQKDCDFTRVIDGVFPCMSDEEYVDYLLDMDCETYTWNNVLQIPKCKKTLDKQ